MSFSKEDLAAYRISRSKESLEEAIILAENGHWNTTANRLYYACFYMVSAYLLLHGFEASTHVGIKAGFNQFLIQTQVVDRSSGQLYNTLFNIRQEADYRDFKDLDQDRVKPMISKVEALILDIESKVKPLL